MRILSNFDRLFPISFGYTSAILPLGNRFLPTWKELFFFERFSQGKILSGKFAWMRQKEQKNFP